MDAEAPFVPQAYGLQKLLQALPVLLYIDGGEIARAVHETSRAP